jgi:hypothetical protein
MRILSVNIVGKNISLTTVNIYAQFVYVICYNANANNSNIYEGDSKV